MIKSWTAYALSTVAVIVLGFVKVKIPAYPIETVVTAIVTITLGYFGKRLAQRHKKLQNGAAKGGMSED